MTPFLHQLRVSLLLHFRNRMAIVYSYLFPTIFLIAFAVLYRHETVPLIRHIGEILTVTALGGACFGLPTTMVSERERGVWRRYRLAPVATGTLLASTILARYLLLVIAALLQVSLALLIGMPLPNHPLELLVAFTFVAFALMGLGLVIAMLADNVPAVQALGQCIFLPMLIIGGVAVQLASLPEWAQRLSAYFPGRYAVEAMQACASGDGLGSVGFSLLALLLIGSAAFLGGVKLFRWEPQQRFAARAGKGWIAVALSAWAAVGLVADARGTAVLTTAPTRVAARTPEQAVPSPPESGESLNGRSRVPAPDTDLPPQADPPPPVPAPAPPAAARDTTAAPVKPVPELPPPPAGGAAPADATPPSPKPEKAPEPAGPPPPPETWRDVTRAHIDEIMFPRLPPDSGVVAPIGPVDELLDPDVEGELEDVRNRLPAWRPARVDDPVQRVRNILYVAAVPDVFQLPIERHMPHIVFERLQADFEADDLIKLLYWVATHPGGGDDSALDELRAVGLRSGAPYDVQQTRERVMLYALKLLGRLVGEIPW